MPQIQDYSITEVQGAQPVGGLSPNLEAASAPGRALQRVGEGFMDLGDALHRREAAKETSQVYATYAKGRQEWTQKMLEAQTQENFDADDFMKGYQDWSQKMGENVNTPEARNFFDRQTARLGGQLTTLAARLQSEQAGREGRVLLQTALNSDATTLETDPSQFMDIKQAGIEALDEMVKNNPRLKAASPQLHQHLLAEYSKAAIRGYTKADPGSIDEDRESAGMRAINSGVFDQYLSPEEKVQMTNYVRAQSKAADSDAARQTRAVAEKQKALLEDWHQDVLPSLLNNSLSAKQVMDAKLSDGTPVPFHAKMDMIEKIRQNAKEPFKRNSAVYSGVMSRIYADDDDPARIQDPQEIYRMVGKGLTAADAASAVKILRTRPDQQTAFANEKNMMKAAASSIKKQSMAGGGYDPTSMQKYALFADDLQAAKEAQRQAGKPVADLFDPHKPDYFLNKASSSKYQTSTSEILANQMRNLNPEKANARKEGESSADYLARMKGNK